MQETETVRTWRALQILLVAGTAAATTPASAQSSVTVYGIFDAGLEASDSGRGATKRMISGGSYGSRLGFRGNEDLGGGLSAVFRLESGFAGDTGALGQGGRIFGREATVGLAHRELGTLTIGRIPTPVSLTQARVDAFNWMGSGGMISITRSGTATRQLMPQVVSARVDNAVNYFSPNWGGFEMRALVALGEDSPVIDRTYGASVRYLEGPWDLVAAYGRQEGSGSASGRITSVVVGGSYNFKVAKIFAGYTNEKNTCSTCTGALARAEGVSGGDASEFQLVNLGVRIPVGNLTAIAQVVRVNDRSRYAVNLGDRDATWFAVGAEYPLSRRTVLYGALGTIDNRNGSQYALGSGGVQQPPNFVDTDDPRSSTLSLGIRHLF